MNAEALQYFYLMTSRVTVVVSFLPPPVAVMVIVRSPVVLPTLTVIVDVPVPGAAIEVGLKVTVCPLPCPEADKVIAELKPPETIVVIVAVPDEFLSTEIELGDAEMVKPADTPDVTVRETVAVCVSPPPVPVIVML